MRVGKRQTRYTDSVGDFARKRVLFVLRKQGRLDLHT
jgi:hypothetical protein